MDLQSGSFYWPTTLHEAETPSYPPLAEDADCDVLIVGCGSSGAQCAYYLAETGLKIIMVDKRKAGMGSTATNTALIQYAGDKTFTGLVNSFGESCALRHLKRCEEAIQEIEASCASLPFDAEFVRRDTLYSAFCEEDVPQLQTEYALLTKHGFDVEWWEEERIASHYPWRRKAAIYYKNDAEMNPYTYNLGLLEHARSRGVRIYEHTEINGHQFEQDYNLFYTGDGYTIKASHVIIASGYEGLEFRGEKNAVITSSYSIVTEPVEAFTGWHVRTLLWDSARPYIYARTTADRRIIIGGLDESTSYAEQRDAKLKHKSELLLQELAKLFPAIPAKIAYQIAAFYGGTHDGLPIIGQYDDFPRCYYLFGYGDNGTVYNMVLAREIRDLIMTGSSPYSDIYLQTRPVLNP
ncbi:NAD(P)/FAD-dependent oxidoreductase [Paenibacillus sp. GCM10023252]|uniref:NAD(P)/FAD-dependent oxidoreductase n=1 Tax=Paenibacillus sp. GCM10023252 TaxID=3252649 RepID=UPI00360CBCCF